MPTETYYSVGGRITLYSYTHHREPIRITATALTDLNPVSGSVRISDWRINEERTKVTLIIPQDSYPVEDGYPAVEMVFPCELKETALPSPGRSFRWSEFGGYWVHKKTGVRVINA